MGFCPKILVRGLGMKNFFIGKRGYFESKIKERCPILGGFLGGVGGWGSFWEQTPVRGPPKVNREES